MKIVNKNNYEIFIIDYLDGSLNPDQEALLFRFLNEHPEIKKEFEELNNKNIDVSTKSFENKSILKKTIADKIISKESFEEFCIAKLEGDLTKNQEEDLNTFLPKNSDKKDILNIYLKLKLNPDKNINYPNKSILQKSGKKKVIILQKIISYSAVAASLLIAVILFNSRLPQENVAIKNSPEEKTKVIVTDTNQKSDFKEKQETKTDSTPKRKIEDYFKDAPQHNKVIPEVGTVQKRQIEKKVNNQVINDINKLALRTIQEVESTMQKTQVSNLRKSSFTLIRYNYIAENKNIKTSIIKFVKTNVLKEPVQTNPNKISLWDFADAGIRGLNEAAGWNIQFERDINEKGKTVGINYNSKLINYQKEFGGK